MPSTSSPSDQPNSDLPADSQANSNTSKNRFQVFLKNFASGKLKQDLGHDDSDKNSSDESPDGKSESKKVRRGYLRLYIQTLWRHWPMVLALVTLAVLVSILEIIQPLFARHIIDQILLKDLTPAQQLYQLNFVGGMFLLVVVVTRVLGVARAWNQRSCSYDEPSLIAYSGWVWTNSPI
ncbi:hypothetical protein N9Y42_09265 [Mariniblastus sp.]|nr:hypothetical protein [Mariniblastus sp.]